MEGTRMRVVCAAIFRHTHIHLHTNTRAHRLIHFRRTTMMMCAIDLPNYPHVCLSPRLRKQRRPGQIESNSSASVCTLRMLSSGSERLIKRAREHVALHRTLSADTHTYMIILTVKRHCCSTLTDAHSHAEQNARLQTKSIRSRPSIAS